MGKKVLDRSNKIERERDGSRVKFTAAPRIDTMKMAKPSFLMVLTAVVDCAYTRPDDGVIVCPIGCLRD